MGKKYKMLPACVELSIALYMASCIISSGGPRLELLRIIGRDGKNDEQGVAKGLPFSIPPITYGVVGVEAWRVTSGECESD